MHPLVHLLVPLLHLLVHLLLFICRCTYLELTAGPSHSLLLLDLYLHIAAPAHACFSSTDAPSLTLLGPQSRLGDKLLEI